MSAAAFGEAATLAWAASVVGTTAWASFSALRDARRARKRRAALASCDARDVLLVRPCAGRDRNLRAMLQSTAELEDALGLRVVFAVPSESDPACGVAREVAAELADRGVDAAVEITTTAGPNNKAAQLATVVARTSPERSFVVVADSDVNLAGARLAALLAPLRADGAVGAAWAAPVEAPGVDATLGDRVSRALLAGSLHAFPVLAALDKTGLVGKLFAVRRATLERAGGFGALINVLGEDVALASRIRELGERVELAPIVARAHVSGRSVATVAARFGRWLTVVRGQRPALLASYPLLFSATWPLIALALVLGTSAVHLGLAAVVLGARLAVARVAAHVAGVRAPSIALVLLADAVLLWALGRAVSTRRVRWRDRELILGPRGELLELTSGARSDVSGRRAAA
ncbi:MAG: glycosyltransferase [Polyangiaceae bacterium]